MMTAEAVWVGENDGELLVTLNVNGHIRSLYVPADLVDDLIGTLRERSQYDTHRDQERDALERIADHLYTAEQAASVAELALGRRAR